MIGYHYHNDYTNTNSNNSRKFIVAIPVRNPWWEGFLLKRAKDLF